MSIVDSIIQRKAGLPSVQVELGHTMPTSGHMESHGGLRGHSVDGSIYPFRVVGHPGGVWSVQDAKGFECGRWDYSEHVGISEDLRDAYACTDAHESAKLLKKHCPEGVVSPS